jgi:hypothetical protein
MGAVAFPSGEIDRPLFALFISFLISNSLGEVMQRRLDYINYKFIL